MVCEETGVALEAEQHDDVDVIGAGYARTGTSTLAAALEQLGVAPCYKDEALERDAAFWMAASQASDPAAVDWDAVLHPYRSIVDLAGALFWRPLIERYPSARVILTVRDVDRWYESMGSLLVPLLDAGRKSKDPLARLAYGTWWELGVEAVFGDDFHDRDRAKRALRDHNAAVEAGVPQDRLLVFDVASGWSPLCHFLGVPVPETDFPYENKRGDVTREFAAGALRYRRRQRR